MYMGEFNLFKNDHDDDDDKKKREKAREMKTNLSLLTKKMNWTVSKLRKFEEREREREMKNEKEKSNEQEKEEKGKVWWTNKKRI
jgi:hypothetical protein